MFYDLIQVYNTECIKYDTFVQNPTHLMVCLQSHVAA